MRVLRTIDSLGNKREFPLNLQEGEQISFGRLDTCDISLPGESNLSREHCHIRCASGRIYIRDNASVNGVYCNGVAVVEAEMRPGVKFVLGLCTITLAEHPESAAEPACGQAASPARRIQTAAGAAPRRKRSRRPVTIQQHPADTADLPHSESGSELGLPVDFAVSLNALVPRYPLRAEDTMTLSVSAERQCSIAVIQYDATGEPALIVPGSERDRTTVFPNVKARFPRAAGADYELVAEEPFGPVQLVLLACTAPCNWSEVYNSAVRSLNTPCPLPGKLEHAMIAACPAAEPPADWSSAVLRLITQP